MAHHLEIVPTFVAQLDGKILPNAHAVVDVDGDDLHDLVFGSVTGAVAVYKISPTRFIKKQECRVNGCVSAICADGAMPNDMRIFVATTDGTCFVIQATESGDDFFPSAEFRVALNVSDVALHGGFVVFGTREGTILVYSSDPNAYGGFRQVHTYSLGFEIESFVELLADSTMPQFLARCTSGEVFELQFSDEGEVSASRWRAPSHGTAENAVSFLIDAVRVDGQDDGCVACGSLGGRIEVLTENGNRVWDYELSEAVIGMDRVPIGDNADVLLVCTWSGVFYAIKDPLHIAHFRMVLPASSMFCADVLMGPITKPQRLLVGISTSGVISIYLGIHDALKHALDKKTLLQHVNSSTVVASIDSEEKRRMILKKLLEKTDQSEASELSMILSQPSVEVADLLRLATTQQW